jgi:hypothetical protein
MITEQFLSCLTCFDCLTFDFLFVGKNSQHISCYFFKVKTLQKVSQKSRSKKQDTSTMRSKMIEHVLVVSENALDLVDI